MITKLMNILTPEAIYGLICATVFCVIFAVAGKARHAQHYTFSQGLVLVLFLLYLWQVWMFTGVGTLSNVLAREPKVYPLRTDEIRQSAAVSKSGNVVLFEYCYVSSPWFFDSFSVEKFPSALESGADGAFVVAVDGNIPAVQFQNIGCG